jgi:Protein of unknown function (DUF3500)
MQASLSSEGYQRVLAEWNADEALAQHGGGGGGQTQFGKKYYYIALIGTPSDSDPWMWQFGGHHVTVNATVAGGHILATPSFIGVQPSSYTDASGRRPSAAARRSTWSSAPARTARRSRRRAWRPPS